MRLSALRFVPSQRWHKPCIGTRCLHDTSLTQAHNTVAFMSRKRADCRFVIPGFDKALAWPRWRLFVTYETGRPPFGPFSDSMLASQR
jgi:hypothetical protein